MKQQTGFTLIELMITVAIVAILAMVAIPAYQDYSRKARFSEVIGAASPLKNAVAACAYMTGELTACSNGSNGVPAAVGTAGQVESVVVNSGGVITVTPVASHGIVATDTYILTPRLSNGAVVWSASGGCINKGLCA